MFLNEPFLTQAVALDSYYDTTPLSTFLLSTLLKSHLGGPKPPAEMFAHLPEALPPRSVMPSGSLESAIDYQISRARWAAEQWTVEAVWDVCLDAEQFFGPFELWRTRVDRERTAARIASVLCAPFWRAVPKKRRTDADLDLSLFGDYEKGFDYEAAWCRAVSAAYDPQIIEAVRAEITRDAQAPLN